MCLCLVALVPTTLYFHRKERFKPLEATFSLFPPKPFDVPAQNQNLNPPLSSSPQATLEKASDMCGDIYQLICHKTGTTRDPTGTVRPDAEGEILALRTYEELIHQYPKWSSSEIDEELVKIIYTPARRTRLETVFKWVLGALNKFVDAQPRTVFSSQEKRQLKQRLNRTKLELPPPASVYADEPDLLTKNDVFYERTRGGGMRLRVGGAYVTHGKSWFNLVFTFAHELAHAIDPCEIRSAHLSFIAYDRLSACFLRNNLIATRKNRSECVQNDQLSETFADWVAVHITGDALRAFSATYRGPELVNAATNAVRDLCEQDEFLDDPDLEFHPHPKIRIDRIFGRNPRVRQVLGCAPSLAAAEYCDFDSVPPNHPIKAETPETNREIATPANQEPAVPAETGYNP